MNLDYCVVLVNLVDVFLEHVHRNLKASEQFTPKFPFVSVLFNLPCGSCSKHHNHCNMHFKSESITGQPALKLVIMTKIPGSFGTVIFV